VPTQIGAGGVAGLGRESTAFMPIGSCGWSIHCGRTERLSCSTPFQPGGPDLDCSASCRSSFRPC
jgi:hypothetical protein